MRNKKGMVLKKQRLKKKKRNRDFYLKAGEKVFDSRLGKEEKADPDT